MAYQGHFLINYNTLLAYSSFKNIVLSMNVVIVLFFSYPPCVFSRDLGNSAPLHMCRKTTGVKSNTRWLTTTTHSYWDLNHFQDLLLLYTSTKGCGRKLILLNLGFPCFISAEPRTRAPLFARRGQRPDFLAGFPVYLRRLTVSREAGASAGLFFFTSTDTSELRVGDFYFSDHHRSLIIKSGSFKHTAVHRSIQEELRNLERPVLFRSALNLRKQ